MEIKDLAEVNAELQEKKELPDNIDFKMVTFSLAGKDYGVDIMNIKEIAKADKFTYVPNAANFVRGVYNLRGDIIPIIDLRLFFHLPIEKRQDIQENMLILHIEDRVYGTIVDKIDKVVGVNTTSIQPPHPFFGDINIKYIDGVVEHSGDLYIILDVVRIFSPSFAGEQITASYNPYENLPEHAEGEPEARTENIAEKKEIAIESGAANAEAEADRTNLGFIKDSLAVLVKFYNSPINEKWVENRFQEWKKTRDAANIQLKDANDAEKFLAPFYSPCTEKFWDENYAFAFKNLLKDTPASIIQVWNPGCGKGFETLSLACILKMRYPNKQFKIWANDSDILKISNAPAMTFDLASVPEYCKTFMVKGAKGWSFNQAIKDAIVFEYHNIVNGNVLPKLDIVVCRDVLSHIPIQGQKAIFELIDDRLNEGGFVMLGVNEAIPFPEWKAETKDNMTIFVRRGAEEKT